MLRSIAERYRNLSASGIFCPRLLAVLGASLLTGVLVMICECPDHLPANPTGGKGIEVMQVIAQAKASRGGTLRLVPMQ
jgi:hypothetical protein